MVKKGIFYLALNRPEKKPARSRQLETSVIKLPDVSQSSIGTFSTLRYCIFWASITLILLSHAEKKLTQSLDNNFFLKEQI